VRDGDNEMTDADFDALASKILTHLGWEEGFNPSAYGVQFTGEQFITFIEEYNKRLRSAWLAENEPVGVVNGWTNSPSHPHVEWHVSSLDTGTKLYALPPPDPAIVQDAARYRFLRSASDDSNGPWIQFADGRDHSTANETDAAIDAAIAAAMTAAERVVKLNGGAPEKEVLGSTPSVPVSAATIPEGMVLVPRELAITVDSEGVTFGPFYWVSHESITGCEAELIPTKHKQYFNWFTGMLAAAQRKA
jgi:hypothetical protein